MERKLVLILRTGYYPGIVRLLATINVFGREKKDLRPDPHTIRELDLVLYGIQTDLDLLFF